MKTAAYFSIILMVALSSCQQKKITASEKTGKAKVDSMNNKKSGELIVLPATVNARSDGNASISRDSSTEKNKSILPDQEFIARAFFIVTVPGAQQVDEQGNPIDNFIVTREIYIEHSGTEKPHSIIATTPNGSSYKGAASLMAKEGSDIGTTVINNRRVFLKPKTGNQLWKIVLEPVGFTKQSTQPHVYLDVKAKFGNTLFKTRMDVETQLAAQILY